ncbi:MAG TPA: hypothetical protein VGO47_05175 [Chlamydiales bacterium]|jgi:hypothetical protein|nr:hypothetical protein [Chlamydiales bacterium]
MEQDEHQIGGSTSFPSQGDPITQTLMALQEQVMRMQEGHDEVMRMLRESGMTGNKTQKEKEAGGSPPTPVNSALGGTEKNKKNTGPKPATPSDFDGDRTKGRGFLNSVKWYLRSRGHEFRDLDHMISWTLSFMKEGRALTFAHQVTRQVDKNGVLPYESWELFWKELEERFLPVDEAEEAINLLETDRYYQGKQTVDDYCDRFQDLIDQAGYTEGRQVVMKFRKGLDPEIADKVSLLQEKRPKDDDTEGWITTAKEVARQRIRNEAFNVAMRKDKTAVKINPSVPAKPSPFFKAATPVAKPTVPWVPRFPMFSAKPTPSPAPAQTIPKAAPTGPIPMEVDASRQRGRTPVVCYRCGQAGHFKDQCPMHFDVRFMSTDELEDHLQGQLTQKDVAKSEREPETIAAMVEGEREEEDFQEGHE